MKVNGPSLWLASLLAFFLAVPANAQLAETWTHWRYYRPIELESVNEPRLARVTLPVEVYGLAQTSLADLRVTRDDGTEVPFVLHARVGREERNWRPAEIADLGFIPGEHTEIVIDVGSDHDAHNALEIQTGVDEFFTWVEIAAGDDRNNWRIINDKAPIYRFEDTGDGNTVVSYPDSEAPWLRLRILQAERRFAVYACRVAYQFVEEPELVVLAGAFRTDPVGEADESSWLVDLGVGGVPASAVRFEAEQSEFHRTVRVQASTNGEDWEEVGRGDIYRYRSESEPDSHSPTVKGEPAFRTSLQVRFPEARARYWRVSVLNRNDVPVAGLAPVLQGSPRHVVFRQEPETTYRLLYGNPRTAAPEYDLERLTSRDELDTAVPRGVGDEASNADYVSPAPWSERHPFLLWLALAVAVAVLGLLSLRALR